MTAVLEAEALTSGYGDVRVLHGISFRIEEGSISALVGSNGAGKTTLMKTVAGLLQPHSGRILFGGRQIDHWSASRRVEMGLALVPEGRMVFPDFTVEENLKAGAFVPRARVRAEINMERMFDLFPRLRERRHQRGDTLSGGEQQMLALARGLMSEPRVLLLDEPTLGLAPNISADLFVTIADIRDSGVTVFIVEQDIHSTLEIADHARVMENGRITLEGTAESLLRDDAIRQAYLGL